MSGQFPNNIEIRSVKFSSIEKVLSSRSVSGKRQSRKIGGHLWSAEISLNLMNRSEFNTVFSFLMRQKGSLESFTIIFPGHDLAQGSIDGSPTYASKINDYEIVTNGWSNSVNGNVKACDVFNIAGQSKVYMATDDLDSDVSGNGNLKFYPELRETPGASAALTFDNVAFTCSIESKISYSRSGVFYEISPLTLVEAL